MGTLFLTTVISCQQLHSIANKVVFNTLMSTKQKTELIIELQKMVPSCPLIIKDDNK